MPQGRNSGKPHRLCCIGLGAACSNCHKSMHNRLQNQTQDAVRISAQGTAQSFCSDEICVSPNIIKIQIQEATIPRALDNDLRAHVVADCLSGKSSARTAAERLRIDASTAKNGRQKPVKVRPQQANKGGFMARGGMHMG